MLSIQPVLCSEIVGFAKLRKREHENKTGGDWREERRRCPISVVRLRSVNRGLVGLSVENVTTGLDRF